jgi:sulfatase maturation enzyme AslB (radical SAM superfamily)
VGFLFGAYRLRIAIQEEGLMRPIHIFATKGRDYRMSDGVLRSYVHQHLRSQPASHLSFSWRGGELALPGIPLFARVIELQRKYANASP